MVGRKYENEGIAPPWCPRWSQPSLPLRFPNLRSSSVARLVQATTAYVWARLFSAIPLDVAECADLGDGRSNKPPRCFPESDAIRLRQRAISGAPRRKKLSRRRFVNNTKNKGHPYYASARLWDDGVIDPLDTRPRPWPRYLCLIKCTNPRNKVRSISDVKQEMRNANCGMCNPMNYQTLELSPYRSGSGPLH